MIFQYAIVKVSFWVLHALFNNKDKTERTILYYKTNSRAYISKPTGNHIILLVICIVKAK